MTDTLPDFPVDDIVLSLIEQSMVPYLTEGPDGDPVLEGGDFDMNDLLNFLSGYDPSLLVEADTYYGSFPIHIYTGGPLYHYTDVIRSLIAEVRRLRALLPLDTDG